MIQTKLSSPYLIHLVLLGGHLLNRRSRFHFDSLAHDNDAIQSVVDEIQPWKGPLGNSSQSQPGRVSLVGTQRVSKINRPIAEADVVKILLTVWRVEEKNIDVIMVVNVPVVTGGDGNAKGVGQAGLARAREAWEKAKETFVIDDFGLFA